MKNYIGLEMHIELSTESKMFCGCSAKHFSEKPNINTCPICLGLPGALPYPNEEAIDRTIKIAFALGSDVALVTKFDRKHYFYPDLPKGYQISQYDQPVGKKGNFYLKNGKNIHIRRVHIEEDTGKLMHKQIDGIKSSLVDFNRSGVPLVEIVTEPDFNDTDEVNEFLQELQILIRYLGVSDADMEKGSMRLEANVSVSTDSKLPGYKVELKNINSFKYLMKAISSELERQKEILENGGKIISETRGFDEKRYITFTQRIKEEEKDYRYFPEPDIPLLVYTKLQLNKIKDSIPELPSVKRERFGRIYKLNDFQIRQLTNNKLRAEYFEQIIKIDKNNKIGFNTLANLIINQNADKKYEDPYDLVKHILSLGSKTYADVNEVEQAINKSIAENPDPVKRYKEGKVELLGYFIGYTQRLLNQKGDPKNIRELLIQKLNNI